MSRTKDERCAFRCSIPPEHSAAKLKVGRRFHSVSIVDTSRNGFTLRAPTALANKLKLDSCYDLYFAGERWEVRLESRYSESSESMTMGCSRVRDLTKLRSPSSWCLPLLPKQDAQSDPTFLLYLILAFLVAVFCLPGMGDGLGTAPKVRKGVNTLVDVGQDLWKNIF